MLDPQLCYKALQTRDERFDGRFFVCVTSTGIYCRPVCPAGPPKFHHCRFFPSAAAAQQAGFRPCLRCRPEMAPERGPWSGHSNTVSRGLALIAAGELDGGAASVERLAERLGVGGRQLRRLFRQHLGATPVAVAQTRRVLLAKQLIHETRLPMTEVAFAAGFGSIRRFNETFQKLYQKPPSALRRTRQSALAEGSIAGAGVTVRLRYRAPYDWAAMLGYLGARALLGIERVDDRRYLRTVVQDGQIGMVEVSHLPREDCLAVKIRFPSVSVLMPIISRIRRVFDLAADVTQIGSHLCNDPMLAPLIAQRPGLRVPGGWDGFELAVRAILGQQVTLAAGRQLTLKLARVCGTQVPLTSRAEPSLSLVFPTAAQVAAADLTVLGMPAARRRALAAVAQASLADPLLFGMRGSVDDTVARLCQLSGIGPWTAHYIALRAAREPDAFPASDVALLRSASENRAERLSPAQLLARAENWRPWRGYAAQHLWAADAAAQLSH